jgi:electron transport complex protein RnfD
MGLVMFALAPATVFGLYQFGWPAIIVFVLTIGSALLFEMLSLLVARKPVKPFMLDGSAALTGWLVALSLPPWAPWWIAVLGGFIAIVLGKQIYGGLGQNIFNPAMVARVALLISFPLEMTFFLQPQPLFAAGSPGFLQAVDIVFLGGLNIDALSSATTLTHAKVLLRDGKALSEATGLVPDLRTGLFGALPGSLGEISVLLLVLGGLFLLATKIINWHTPVAMIASMAVMASLFHFFDSERHFDALTHILSGGFILGAFFIATDYVTQPVSNRGRLIFGAGVGFLTFFIRAFSIYPEGVGFSILLMNAMTPLIDHYVKPRVFGRTRSGKPLPVKQREG